jgi:hypothetical protein
MFLLDTNVVSELRRPAADRRVVAWSEGVRQVELYLTLIILRLEHRNDHAQAALIRT